jgi:hypothetical protein
MIKKNLFGAVLMVLFLSSFSYAQNVTGPKSLSQNQGVVIKHHKPSQASIDACVGKSAGDSCGYTTHSGKIRSGTCVNPQDHKYLFCKKNNPSKPSQAPINACVGESVGVSCGYTTPNGKSISGTCANSKDHEYMFCKRNRPFIPARATHLMRSPVSPAP